MGSFSKLLFASLLGAPLLHLRSSRTSNLYAHGLVNVIPITTRPTGHGRFKTLFHTPETAANESDTSYAREKEAATRTSRTAATRTSSRRKKGNDSSNLPMGVWMPPAQNVEQRRGNIFSINQPEDLLDFVIEDERMSVVKVYAGWCKTCQIFDVRYRKLASQFGDRYDGSETRGGARIFEQGRARFAEMELKDRNEEILSTILSNSKQPIALPYVLLYKGSSGMVRDFRCAPSAFRVLVDAVNELADPAVSEEGVRENGTGGAPPTNGDDSATPQKTLDATTTISAKGFGGATQVYLSTLSAPVAA